MSHSAPKRLIAALMVAVSLGGLSGCGFALRGTTDHALQITPAFANASISLEDTPTAFALKSPLTQQLQLVGVQTGTTSQNHIDIKNVRFRRFELVGTLTEVRQVLMADVSYTLIKDGKAVTVSSPLQVEHSYQHNEASVVTGDQQGERVQAWLYDALAQRIAEQYRTHALAN